MMFIHDHFHQKVLSMLSFVTSTFSTLQFVQQVIVLRSVLGQLPRLPSLQRPYSRIRQGKPKHEQISADLIKKKKNH